MMQRNESRLETCLHASARGFFATFCSGTHFSLQGKYTKPIVPEQLHLNFERNSKMKTGRLRFSTYALVAFCFVMLTTMKGLASSIYFTNPSNGQIFVLSPGQTTYNVYFTYNYTYNYQPVTKINIDGIGWEENLPSPFYRNLSTGSHTVWAELWEWDPFWGLVKTAQNQISFSIVPSYNVTFKNSFEYGQIRVGDWNSRPLRNSPYVEPVTLNSTRVMEAFDQNYQAPNEQNYYRVWQSWSRNGGAFGSNNPVETVPVPGPNELYLANFNRQFNINIAEATCVELGSGGTYKVNGTDVGATWQGTFIEEQSALILLEAVPPSSDWLFACWNDNGADKYTNPRTLIPVDHTTLYATFKKHLASTSSNVTAPNTQRKVVRDHLGTYHMVYESGQAIWYSRSTDNGGTWLPEVLLSGALDPGNLNRTPSIAFHSNTYQPSNSRVLVIWEAYMADESDHAVLFRELDINGQPVGDVVWLEICGSELSTHGPVIGIALMPSLSGPLEELSEYVPLAVWYNGSTNTLRGSVRYSSGNWSPTVDLVGDASSYSLAPFCFGDAPWHLAYVQDNSLYYAPIEVNVPPVLGSPELVAKGDDGTYVRNPSIIGVNRSVGISWEDDYWEFVSGAVRYSQRYGSDQWTTPVGWMPQLGWYRTPSLTADFYHTPVTLAWQNENTSLFYLQGEIGSWGETTNLGTGANPTMSAAFSSGESDLALWRGLNSPYPILQEAITVHYSAHNGLSNITTREGRGARLMFKNGSLHIGILMAK
jgi:hypothetical protein